METNSEWLEGRKKYIGGSDVAALLGMSKYKTPYQLWLEKTGQSPAQDDNWAMMRGRALEPALRQHYADKTGLIVSLPVKVMVSDKYPFMCYNPDGLTREKRLVEFKTATYSKAWGEEGTDEVPQPYLLQIQHGMFVTGFEVCDVTVSIGGNEPKYYIVEADKELQEMIIEKEVKFWELVQNNIEPEPINNDDVAAIYKQVNGQSIIANQSIIEALHNLKFLRENIKKSEQQKEHLEVMIKQFMGENERMVDDSGNVLTTWKQAQGAKRIDTDMLRSNYPDIAELVTKVSAPSRRFLVK